MAEVVRGDVDGVAAFWVDSGRPTLTASLVVRQGMVDETLPTTGWTHLLEHLALHDRASGALHVNGSVSPLLTRFDAHGPADRVAEVLGAVTRWLAGPGMGELERERSVLRAEAAVRGLGEVNVALLQRYGAQGPGLAGYAEPGLSRADEPSLLELAARVFVTGNCSLFLDGPPPPTLRLHLPEGPRRPVPVAQPCGDRLPAAYVVRGGITLSGVVPRSVAATFLPHVLRELLTEDFREGFGGAYAPWSHYEAVDGRSAVVFCGSDSNDALLRSIADRGLELVARLADGELRERLVGDIRDQLLQVTTDPYNLPGLAFRAAADHLRDEPPVSLEEAVEEIRSVSPEHVVAEANLFRGSLLVGIDGDARWDTEVPMLHMRSGVERLPGRSHRSRNYPAHRESLVVGAEAVQIGASKEYRTVRREEVAGLFAYPDGGREVVARDGWSIRVEPTMWAAGREATRGVDAMVPPELHIPMLERESGRVPRPASLARRLQHALRPRGVRGALWVVVALLLPLGLWVAITVSTGSFPAGALAAVVASYTVSYLRSRRRR